MDSSLFVYGFAQRFDHLLLWYPPLVLSYLAWPVLKRRRAYAVAAAVLCLTPAFAGNFEFWPLVVALPWYATEDLENFRFVAYWNIPCAAFVGVMSWMLVRRYVPASGCSNVQDNSLAKGFARAGAQLPDSGDSSGARKSPGRRLARLLRKFRRHLLLLFLLLIGVLAYVQLWYLGLSIFTLL